MNRKTTIQSFVKPYYVFLCE